VQSASVLKALLLVAYLRQPSVRSRPLRRAERHMLSPMIRWSNNHDASAVVAKLGAARIDRTAHRAGMRRFHHIDAPRHRAWGMQLLRTVVHTQRWGVGEVIPAGWTAYFKGGWGSGIGLVDHQVALLTRGQERVSIAVLTTTDGMHRVGKATLRGVFRRLLRRLAASPPP
jgi:hypothetical protein